MVKYFFHERSDNLVNAAYPHKTEKEINQFAEKNNLEVISLSCMEDTGVFVVFREKS